MAKFTVKDLKKALENLDESKEVNCSWRLDGTSIEVDYVKEIKENGREYYNIKMQNMIENKTTKLIEDNKIEETLRELKKEVEENEKLFKEHDISIDEIVNLVSYFKGKKEGIISLTIIAVFRALSFELSISLWETLKKVMEQKAVEHFSKTFDTK